jgi:CheY-like chemotaxis protein
MAKVLVIDDDAGLRAVVCRGLRHVGHEVIDAVDGDAGLEAARRHHPRLVITDIVMPGRDGIETIVALAALDPRPVIIAVSGMTGADGFTPLDDARLLGADAVLRKPFVLAELLETAERLLRPGDSDSA